VTIDCELQSQLDQAEADDLIAIILILKASAVMAESPAIEPANLAEGRKRFARNATKLLNDVIQVASGQCGKIPAEQTIFGHMASARLCAPARLIEHMAEHPAVATIGLASDNQCSDNG